MMNEPMILTDLGTSPQCTQIHHFCYDCEAVVCGFEALEHHEHLGHDLSVSFAPRSAGARRRICGIDVVDPREFPGRGLPAGG